ncbi:MAG: hypothetical protein DHS20C17_33970 [Cyclobacteriaceae bacterium]|nr:MAG: hypothetical protein DHS20C17_33970 [Cyclobacteriaceae bacterium]
MSITKEIHKHGNWLAINSKKNKAAAGIGLLTGQPDSTMQPSLQWVKVMVTGWDALIRKRWLRTFMDWELLK